MVNDKETNLVCVSGSLCQFKRAGLNLVEALHREGIAFRIIPNTSSIRHVWARDFMPVQIDADRFVMYTYNPDYLQDARSYIPEVNRICEAMQLNCKETPLVIDGGNVVKCGDKIIMTDKVLCENPSMKKNDVLAELEHLFEAEPVLIPWDRYEPYGHADGMVRYVGDDMVLLNNYNNFDKALRKMLLKALSPHFNVVELHYNVSKCSEHSWGYINFLQVNGHLFVPMFGQREDEMALQQLQNIYSFCKIHPIWHCEEIAACGGVLNCVTWNVLFENIQSASSQEVPL